MGPILFMSQNSPMIDCYEHVKEPLIYKRQFLDSILDTVPLNFFTMSLQLI